MLRSLELFGFKSFADRTPFEFAPGITCVVGPNGSGKSNVVDAIKWVLGDQSAKSLRGKEMADVLFNGSSGRKPSGFAEATLTFDNSSGLFSLDSAEVQIGRRLFRSGDSEYLLNRTPVRLKDVRDLFMGTGAGTAAYSIIEQGRVDQILQANPAARRMVFEEAAGISKYKSRKVDAERRLERVAQNLARLTDIVDEVETQLNATRSQAGKAARFRELSQELQRAWTGLAADDYRHLSAQLTHRREELDTLGRVVEEAIEQAQRAERERRQTEEGLSQIEDIILDGQRKTASLRESIAALESTLRHQSRRRSEVDAEVSRLRSQLAAVTLQSRRSERELRSIDEKLVLFEQEFHQSKAAIEHQEGELAGLRRETDERKGRIQHRRREMDSLQQERSVLVETAAGLKSRLDGLKQSEHHQQEALQHAEAALQRAGAELHEHRQELARAEAAQAAAQAEADRLQSERADLTVQQSDAEHHLQQLRERRSGAEARLAVLEEQEQRQEGVAIGIRDILRRAEASRYPPWNSILGVVGELLDVPLELAPVIEAALGERAQLIAVTRLDPWLEYLSRGPAPIAGRVGFVALHPSRAAPQPQAGVPVATLNLGASAPLDFSKGAGVIERADRLVQESGRAAGIAQRVLSDTWVVESLDDARRLAERVEGVCRFVTMQGEVLDTSDGLIVGTVPHDVSLVSRRSELRQFKAEVRQLERGIEAYQQRRTILGTTLCSHDEQLEQALKGVQRQSTAVTECSTRLAGLEQQLQQSQASFERLLQEVEIVNQQKDEVEQQLDVLLNQTARLNLEISGVKEGVEEEERQLQEIESILDAARQAIRDEQLELAKHGERLNSLNETQQRLRSDQRQRDRQERELRHRLSETLASRRQTELQMLADESAMAELFVDLEQRLAENAGIASERDRLRASRAVAARAEEELHRRRRELSDSKHALEMEVRDIEHQVRVLGERIGEEYQTTLEDLAASGVSAYADLLRERFPEGEGEEQAQEQSKKSGFSIFDVRFWVRGNANERQSKIEDPAPKIAYPTFGEVREELESRVERLRRKIKSMGTVNTQALDNLEELGSRYANLSGQLTDLQEAKTALEDIIRRINGESKRLFLETFETIRVHFRELFRKLFGGGDADIVLEDPDDVLECGIDIVARPPGKELRGLSLLSGGEKTMTAVALLFAMFKSKPSPYCILDEVDAALDEANVDRYVAVVKEFASMTQFVIITHRKRTMTAADVIYGVTMEQAGVSKRMSVRFEEVAENGEIRSRGAA